MKYLKKFKILEGIDNNIVSDIEEILLPIKDLGYNNKAQLEKDYDDVIFLNIIDYECEPLLFTDDIKDEFLRLIDYLEINDLKIDSIYYKKVEPDGRIFNRGSRDMLNISTFGSDYLLNFLSKNKIAYLSLIIKEK